jgi:hypothetical protein
MGEEDFGIAAIKLAIWALAIDFESSTQRDTAKAQSRIVWNLTVVRAVLLAAVSLVMVQGCWMEQGWGGCYLYETPTPQEYLND